MLPGMSPGPGLLARGRAMELAYQTAVASASSGAGTTIYTFSAVALGAAESGRYVIVACGGERGGPTTINSITVAGIAATEVISRDGVDNQWSAIWIAAVPGGTTGDIVVSMDLEPLTLSVATWALYGASSATAVATGTGTTSCGASVQTGDVVVVAAQNGSGTGSTLTNATERFDINQGGAAFSGGDHVATATESRTFTNSNSSDIVAAVWR